MPIDAETRAKLARILPRLSSEHDGEVVATVRALERILKSGGASVHDLSEALTRTGGVGGLPQIIYRDRIVEKPVIREKIVEKIVEKVVYRDRPTESDAPRGGPARTGLFGGASGRAGTLDDQEIDHETMLRQARELVTYHDLKNNENDFVSSLIDRIRSYGGRTFLSSAQSDWWNSILDRYNVS